MHALKWSEAAAYGRSGGAKWTLVVACALGAAAVMYFTPGFTTMSSEELAAPLLPAAAMAQEVDEFEAKKKSATVADLPDQF
jgi:hypothetical protein